MPTDDSLPTAAGGASGAVVEIAREDFDVILNGLRDMPVAITQMADSVKVLADNTDRAPTKSFTTVIIAAAVVLIVFLLGGGLWVFRDGQLSYQREAADRGRDTNATVNQVADCIDILPVEEDGTPVGECAIRITSAAAEIVAEFRQDNRCSTQIALREFLLLNPELGILTPPSISPTCEDYEPLTEPTP